MTLWDRVRPYQRAVVVLVVALVVVFAVGAIVHRVNDSNDKGTSAGPLFSPNVTVLYEVEGSVSHADVTLQTPTGQSQQTPDIPMTAKSDGHAGLTFTFPAGSFVYISAQKPGEAGTITCRISVDGTVISENTSSSPYGIATCEGKS